MSLSDNDRQTVVRLQLEKAQSNMTQIPLLQQAGYWDTIANRLYYALFHAVSALLINDGHGVGTHRGAVGAFGQFYVTTGDFSLQEGKLYSRLQAIRERSDYNCTYTATENDVAPLIVPVRDLIDKIQQRLLTS